MPPLAQVVCVTVVALADDQHVRWVDISIDEFDRRPSASSASADDEDAALERLVLGHLRRRTRVSLSDLFHVQRVPQNH